MKQSKVFKQYFEIDNEYKTLLYIYIIDIDRQLYK